MTPIKTVPVPSGPIAMRKSDGKLWHTVKLPHGTPPMLINFFNGTDEEYVHGLTNVMRGCLPYGQMFRIKRISLMPALDSLPSDADKLLSGATFYFSTPVRDYYSGPAQTFAKSRGLDTVLSSMKKLPKKAQLELLQNMKVPNGLELSDFHELQELECFRARLVLNSPIVIKKEMKITCLLEGIHLRACVS